jgi:hypothetical protein
MTIWVLDLYHRPDTRPIPPAFRLAARLLCPLRGPHYCCKRHNQTGPDDKDDFYSPRNTDSGKSSLNGRATVGIGGSDAKTRPSPTPTPEAEVEEAEVTWQEVARLFDKLFLVIALLIMGGLSVSILAALYEAYYRK